MDHIRFFRSYRDAIKELPDEMRVAVYDAVFDYALDGIEPQLSGIPFAVFSLMRPNIDASNKIAAKNTQNGAKGGRPKSETEGKEAEEKPIENPNKTQVEPIETQPQTQKKGGVGEGVGVGVGVGEGSMDKGSKSARKPRFTPPTVEEVADYCRERKNGIDPQQFVDFYASKGWFVGKNKMTDWKSCVRTWERREDPTHERQSKSGSTKGRPPSFSEPGNDLVAKFMRDSG